jgi:hypothetical protein
MLGLPAAAWVVVLTATATYIALASGWILSIPARRATVLHGNIAAIEAELSDEPLLRQVQEEIINRHKRQIAQYAGTDRRLIRRGVGLLVVSFLTFSAAVLVQVRTDESLREAKDAPATIHNVDPAAPLVPK